VTADVSPPCLSSAFYSISDEREVVTLSGMGLLPAVFRWSLGQVPVEQSFPPLFVWPVRRGCSASRGTLMQQVSSRTKLTFARRRAIFPVLSYFFCPAAAYTRTCLRLNSTGAVSSQRPRSKCQDDVAANMSRGNRACRTYRMRTLRGYFEKTAAVEFKLHSTHPTRPAYVSVLSSEGRHTCFFVFGF